jgi:hypothetical protein
MGCYNCTRGARGACGPPFPETADLAPDESGRPTTAEEMLLRSLVVAALCYVPACTCLVVGGAAGTRGALAPPLAARPRFAPGAFRMKSKEDIEFEEWVRAKKIASGVDPDEDFGAGRRAEGSIYLVGGTPRPFPADRRPPRTPNQRDALRRAEVARSGERDVANRSAARRAVPSAATNGRAQR